jgi:hypothetical protein
MFDRFITQGAGSRFGEAVIAALSSRPGIPACLIVPVTMSWRLAIFVQQ